jgi:hypothetical protein
MRIRVKNRSIIYGATGMCCLVTLMISGRPMGVKQRSEIFTPGNSAKSSLLVLVKPQPDAPLLISGIKIAPSSDPKMPTVRFIITNNTKKRILAYAIRHDATMTNSTFPGTIAVNFPDRNRALQGGGDAQLEISSIQYSEAPLNLTLSVDFVEFVDGTRWGPDTFKQGERINGVRAGTKRAKEVMSKALAEDGPDVLIHSLDSIKVEADQPDLHTSEWLDGFRHGVGWMRERVRNKGKDLVEIKRELERSID